MIGREILQKRVRIQRAQDGHGLGGGYDIQKFGGVQLVKEVVEER